MANVGDSRAILCRNGEAKQITVDHEPLKEKQQVESRGGFVSQMPGTLLFFFLFSFCLPWETESLQLKLDVTIVQEWCFILNETRQIFWSEFHDTSCNFSLLGVQICFVTWWFIICLSSKSHKLFLDTEDASSFMNFPHPFFS